jgi:hypothetical protein
LDRTPIEVEAIEYVTHGWDSGLGAFNRSLYLLLHAMNGFVECRPSVGLQANNLSIEQGRRRTE